MFVAQKAFAKSNFSRVEMWRGGLGRSICFRPFRVPVPHYPDRAPFPHPAHRTGQALLTHPALGGNITFWPTESCRSSEWAGPNQTQRTGLRQHICW